MAGEVKRSAEGRGRGGREILQRDTRDSAHLFCVGEGPEGMRSEAKCRDVCNAEFVGLTKEWGDTAKDGLGLGSGGGQNWQIGAKGGANTGWRQSSRVNHSGEQEAIGRGEVEPGEGTEPGETVGRIPRCYEERLAGGRGHSTRLCRGWGEMQTLRKR